MYTSVSRHPSARVMGCALAHNGQVLFWIQIVLKRLSVMSRKVHSVRSVCNYLLGVPLFVALFTACLLLAGAGRTA